MDYKYTYEITDFLSGECNLDNLELEIKYNNSLDPIFLFINLENNKVDIFFSEELSVGYQNILDNIIDNHNSNITPSTTELEGDVSIGGSIYINQSSDNYSNSNFALVDPLIGLADSNIPFSLYGSQFHYAENSGVSSTTSSNFITKVSLTTSDLPPGAYNILINYGWSQSDGDGAFEGRVLLNSNQIGEIHRAYPTTGDKFGNGNIDSNWLDFSSRQFTKELDGVNIIEIQWRSDSNTARIADANIQLFRAL